MTNIQSKLKQKFFNKRAGVIGWLISWLFVSLLFDSHPHFPAFFTPPGFLWSLFVFLSDDPWDFLFFEEFVFPAAVFWLVLISVIVFFPSKQT